MVNMAATNGPRKTISIHDYPEHLNPFREEDNHNKIRFWTIGRKINRSNSISFSGIKDLKNSWAFRSFIKKGKREQQKPSQEKKSNNQVNGDTSPIAFRRALQYSSTSTAGSRSTVSSPERADRYVYGGSVTPLPRSRFQERLRSPSQHEVSSISLTPRMARSDVMGSRLSVESTNPFDEGPVPPVRASRRKKKRAPPPPPGTADVTISSVSDQETSTVDEKTDDMEVEQMKLNVELKIIEDNEDKNKNEEIKTSSETTKVINKETNNVTSAANENQDDLRSKNKNVEVSTTNTEEITENSIKEKDALETASFPKVDIVKYRRNSSLNEDDIKLRRGNLEDFHLLSNKRSKSLGNTLDSTHVAYDIDVNDNINDKEKDANGNNEPQRVVCNVYETSRKQSIDNSVSSTEKEFIEIDKATRELEREISKLNSALTHDETLTIGTRLSVSDIKRRFDKNDVASPNPIPKPRRSHYGGSNSPVNGNS